MFGKLAPLMYRRRRTILGIWLVILIGAALASQVGTARLVKPCRRFW